MKRTVFLIFLFYALSIFAQERHQFTITKKVETTSVKSQGNSGTCWAFATTSFVETELLRTGFGEVDLSEMFTVRCKLLPMAEKYVRYQGTSNFGEGGQAHDLLNAVKNFGMIPERAYTGKNIGLDVHNHGEMTAVTQGILDGLLKKNSGNLTSKWKEVIENTLNIYLGNPPEKFEYNGKEITPKTFAEKTGFNPDNYIEITSYLDVPFYEKFILPLPDNWTNSEYYNIPIDEIIQIIDNAINNGYSVCWDGDSGKDHFLRDQCYAVIPDEKVKSDMLLPEVEKTITQEMRQTAFENFDVTDDHLMNIVGTAKNQSGTKFYYTKNSWGTENKKYDGYWYISENYIRLKTVAIMVHKDSIPEEIRIKLGL